MLPLLSALGSLLLFRVRRRLTLELELVPLRHQVTVLRRQRPGRPPKPHPYLARQGLPRAQVRPAAICRYRGCLPTGRGPAPSLRASSGLNRLRRPNLWRRRGAGLVARRYCVAPMQTRSEPVRADRVAREHRAIRWPNFVDRSLHRQNSWPDGLLSMDRATDAAKVGPTAPRCYASALSLGCGF